MYLLMENSFLGRSWVWAKSSGAYYLMHHASFQGNLVWSDMKGFVRIITNSLWPKDANCNMHCMKVKRPSCRPEIVERFLPLLLPNWSKWEGQFLAQNTIVKVSFLGKICPSFDLQLIFFNVALYSINSIGEWWFNWQDPSIEGHTIEKPSI